MQKLFYILLLFLNPVNLYSQQYLFNSLGVEDGLNHSFIESIVQDHYGYIWIATQHGLNRYDGYSFKKYITNPKDTSSFKFPLTRTLYVDNDGDIVSAMYDQLIIFDYSNEIFKYYSNSFVNLSESADEVEGLNIMQDAQEYYWIGTLKNGIWLFDKISEKFLPNNFTDTNGYSIKQIPYYTIDKKNQLWTLAVKENKHYAVSIDLTNFHKKGRPEYSFYFIGKHESWFMEEECSYYTDNENLYLNINNLKIYLFNPENNSWDHLNNDFWTNLMNDSKGEKTRFINDICSDGKNIWIATSENGLYIIDKNYNLIKHILPEDNDKSINDRDVSDLLLDNSDVMWIGTSLGLNFIDINRKKFFEISSLTNLLKNDNVISLSIVNNWLWVSTPDGMSNISPDFHTVKHYEYNENYNHIYPQMSNDIQSYKNNTMLTVGIGVNKLNFNNEIFQYSHPTGKNDAYADWIGWEIHKGKVSDNYWFATQNGLSMIIPGHYPMGITGKQAIMPEKFYTYRQFDGKKKRFASQNLWCLHEAHDSVLWLGSIAGLTRFDLKTEEFKMLGHKPQQNFSTSHPKIKCIYEDSKNRIWVGTEGGGLDLLNNSGENLGNYNIKSGLPSDIVWGILEDDHGNLWISTTDGLSKLNPEKESFVNYYQSHGLTSVEFNRGAYDKGKDGKMYFGTKKGVVAFHPDSIKRNNIPPKVLISQLYLFNKLVKIGEEINGDIILNKSILETKYLELSHKNKVISIEFAGIHFPAPDHITYEYMLEGFDNDWTRTSSNMRRAHYTNLPAGTYVFRVRAANYDGIWSDDEKSILLIKILPPFWKTWWFRALIIIIILAIIYTIFLFRIKNLKDRQLELENLVQERTQEIQVINEELQTQSENLQETNALLEERQEEVVAQNEEIRQQAHELRIHSDELKKLNATKDKFFGIIAHDLRNPFQVITGFSALLKRNYSSLANKKKKEYVNLIEQSSRTISSLLENLLSWSRSQSNNIEYEPKIVDINIIVNETIFLLKLNADKKKITIESNIKNNTLAFFDSNMITTVIRNLVSNAIKFTPENGKIIITAKTTIDNLEVQIKDNGVGMKPETIKKLFRVDQQHTTEGTSGEGGTGLGLIICKEFVEKNGGNIRVESEVNTGSNFIFTLPLNKF